MPRTRRPSFHRAIAKQPIQWGARVRIRNTPDTEALGLAGLTGQVLGLTVPSITRGLVGEIIGDTPDDCAFRVEFDETRPGDFWFSPDLLELMEQGIRIDVEIPQDFLDSPGQTERQSDGAERE
jgi:hypothetical protein